MLWYLCESMCCSVVTDEVLGDPPVLDEDIGLILLSALLSLEEPPELEPDDVDVGLLYALDCDAALLALTDLGVELDVEEGLIVL